MGEWGFDLENEGRLDRRVVDNDRGTGSEMVMKETPQQMPRPTLTHLAIISPLHH